MSKNRNASNTTSKDKEDLEWWQLALIGVGCTIGTGYFLGSTIGIKITGSSIVLSFILAAVGTYIVFNILAKMTAADPQKGSFCYYAGKAYGRWASFSCGWNYWFSNILIMGSQLIALALLSRFWFPHIPLWVFASGYAVLSVLIVMTGAKGFDKIENVLAIIKFAAIVMFIILAIAGLFGWIDGGEGSTQLSPEKTELFAKGFQGFWASLIYAFYAFGGIEVIGIMALQLHKKEDAPKAGKIMMISLTIVYVVSLVLAVSMVALDSFQLNESPFVTALAAYDLAFFPHVFNGAIIIAGFSTMTAALYGVTNLLQALAEEGDAPLLFAKKSEKFKELPLASMGLATSGLVASIVTALLLPEKTYEYITTAAGILLLYNWFFIISCSFRILNYKIRNKVVAYLGLLLILGAISGTLVKSELRPGFWVSFVFIAIIALVCLRLRKTWKKNSSSIKYY
ncbi:amino acid permease [Bacillus sp. N1-1]|uniref:amino acid permease n=1 Tax=Bacillus sp. N1-1 TaxID=2682541 RepID=UPI0013183B42|nr:amino acid permease [Bacillus sp. N1-1]QHA91204.1 amino acid permease [Bacillus sp. N1-1]